MLPARRLSGPLDVGRSGFALARPDAVASVLDAVARGEGPGLVARAWDQRFGQSLAGVAWTIAPRDTLVRVVHELGPRVILAVIGRLLDEGWRSAAGLPDLVVLAGAEGRVPGHPSRVPTGAFFVEVKGPTDSVRDAQTVWFDRLAAAGARVERWDIREA
jgi:hypothetical protein